MRSRRLSSSRYRPLSPASPKPGGSGERGPGLAVRRAHLAVQLDRLDPGEPGQSRHPASGYGPGDHADLFETVRNVESASLELAIVDGAREGHDHGNGAGRARI